MWSGYDTLTGCLKRMKDHVLTIISSDVGDEAKAVCTSLDGPRHSGQELTELFDEKTI